MSEKLKLAQEYHVERGLGLVIDGETFPYYAAADPTWRVQPLDEHMHILWVPILVEAPLPEYGEPDGEPIPEEQP